ncbi:thiol-disulfide oxidoreductase DCC family protein [Spirosoma endbachense]|uniref:DUF393 domain-containing protein n=1 Tax=Spirosoma endbachense TaxID=2666025 RepID=A0A6P1W6T1_9BACT|nr:hypothetical protein [Spirosoma endbachense]QHW00726.1 hypothetical protein GJR95_39405 [Spirosoma endbachense]
MNKLIIYDGSCPMCRLYTKGMVAADQSGRLTRLSNDQLVQHTIISRLDRQRARHEIPMVDLDSGETLYGVDTWIYAFGRRSDLIEKLLSFKWFKVILQKLYAFISYNRRIIITAAPGRWQLLDLQPEFHIGQRLAFILVIFGFISGLFATGYVNVWPPAFLGLVVGQLTLAGLYLILTQRYNLLETMLDYTGHLGMSLLIGGVISALGAITGWAILSLVGFALLIGQHFIRTYRLGLSPWLSVCFTMLSLLLLGSHDNPTHF